MATRLASIWFIFSFRLWRLFLLWTLYLVYSHFLLLFRSKSYPRRQRHPFLDFIKPPETSKIIKRPICIITGASSGLGAAAALDLAAEGYNVVLVARSSERLHKTIEEIKQKHKDAYVKAFQVDLASISEIIKFVSSFKQWLSESNLHPSLQLLVNNAGILATSCRVTSDGYDQMMQTNYIAPFILTNLLLPLLRNSPIPSRIVNVSSIAHRPAWDIQVDKKNLICLPTLGAYPAAIIYEYTKMYILLFSYELHKQLCAMDSSSNITVNVIDPGLAKTNILREFPRTFAELTFTAFGLLGLSHNPEKGVASLIDACLAPPEVSGKYFFGGSGRTIKSSSLSYNAKLAADLWSTSNALFQESLQMKG